MPYLIDGHNLIPKLGYSLEDPQDEIKLIKRLQVFCHQRQTQVEIYFDGGIAGQPAMQKLGNVKAYYVRNGKIADAAIESRLVKLGATARNWSVVSSDRRVLAAAREVHARALTSEEFARLVAEASMEQSIQKKTDANLSEADVSEWMDIFNAPNNE